MDNFCADTFDGLAIYLKRGTWVSLSLRELLNVLMLT